MLSHSRKTRLPQVNKQTNDACLSPTSYANMLRVKVDPSHGQRGREDSWLWSDLQDTN